LTRDGGKRPRLPAPGARVGPYEVVGGAVRGAGAWQVRARCGGRSYAIQAATGRARGRDPENRARERERVAREVGVLASLRHPNIVRVHSLERWPEEGERLWLVTDLVEGERLADWCARQGPATGAICRALERVAWAVEHLHRRGLVHRDLRIDGFRVPEGGEPVLVRFALGGPNAGAAARRAPEHARFLASAAARRRPFEWRPSADLHALGRVLLEALGPRGDGRGLRRRLALRSGVPAPVEEIVRRLLDRDPARRPASAAEVARALGRAVAPAPEPVVGGDPDPEEGAAGVRRDAGEGAPADPQPSTLPAHPRSAAGSPASPPFDAPTIGAAPGFDPGSGPTRSAPAPEPREETATLVREARQRLGAPPAARGRVLAALTVAALVAAAAAATCAVGGPRASGREATGLADAYEPPAPLPEPPARTRAAGRRSAAPAEEERAVDAEIEREFGRPTVTPDGGISSASLAPEPVRAPAPTAEPPWLRRSRRPEAPAAPVSAPRPRGVPVGLHLRATLLTNLDSRTVGHGPVEALLRRPAVARGGVVLPEGTLAFGAAAESGGRFTIRFTRLRLPDDTELAFDGIALARDDGKPGLPATAAVERDAGRGGGEAASRAARGAAGALLDALAPAPFLGAARSAADAALEREPSPVLLAGRVLLLDAGVTFDIWVERSF